MFQFWLKLAYTLLTYSEKSLIIGFGYFLPALASVKAVIHRDVESYHQWITYFLILHIFEFTITPILFGIAFNSALKLPFILWLSLPRYQGALVIYEKCVVPFMDRYERRIDRRIDDVKGETKRRLIGMVLGAGSGLFTGVMNAGQSMIVSGDDHHDDHHAENEMEEEEEEVEKEEEEVKVTKKNKNKRRDPQHSVRGSLAQASSSSLRTESSFGETDDIDDDDFGLGKNIQSSYVRDFMDVLSRGLFVFAHVSKQHNKDDGDTTDKTFQLKVFSYETWNRSLLISSVDSSNDEDDENNDGTWIHMSNVLELEESGEQGIRFCCGDVGNDDVLVVEIVLSDGSDRDILMEGLRACLSAFGFQDKQQEEHNKEEQHQQEEQQRLEQKEERKIDSNELDVVKIAQDTAGSVQSEPNEESSETLNEVNLEEVETRSDES